MDQKYVIRLKSQIIRVAFNPCLIFCWKPINRLFGRFFCCLFRLRCRVPSRGMSTSPSKLFLAAATAATFHSKTLKLWAPSAATAAATTELLRKEFNSFFADSFSFQMKKGFDEDLLGSEQSFIRKTALV